jgi:hypothetical protein
LPHDGINAGIPLLSAGIFGQAHRPDELDLAGTQEPDGRARDKAGGGSEYPAFAIRHHQIMRFAVSYGASPHVIRVIPEAELAATGQAVHRVIETLLLDELLALGQRAGRRASSGQE